MKGVTYCDRGTCLIPSEQVRSRNKECFDVLTRPLFTITRGALRVYRCEQSEEKTYYQAKEGARKARKHKYLSIHDRFLGHRSHHDSQAATGWTEEICLRMDAFAAEDHSYVSTLAERKRYEKT